VTLHISVAGSSSTAAVDVLVVEQLVVPVLLGTPWIDKYVVNIDPKSRSVQTQFPGQEIPFCTPLSPRYIRSDTVVRVAKPRNLDPFAETWVEVKTNRTGLAVIRPTRRRDRLQQAKNGVIEFPEAGETFL
jgi:hypothetical protein